MTKIQSIHHVNYLVRDLSSAVSVMRKILSREPEYEAINTRQVNTARFDLGGVLLVLVQPLNEESVLGQMLRTRGEGLFLLSLGVQSLDHALETLKTRGITPAGEMREGLCGWHVCDIDAGPALGPILQLCQPK